MWIKFVVLSVFALICPLTTAISLGELLTGNRTAGIPLTISLSAGELDKYGFCTKAGVTCQDCNTAVTCIPLPGRWLKMPSEKCTYGQTCNAHLGKCTTEHVPECSPSALRYWHKCEQVGIFPDAFDCRKFHMCSPPSHHLDGNPTLHTAGYCPRHYGYNPQTAQCSIKLTNGHCSKTPVPQCKTLGQYGAVPLSTNHYYICFAKYDKLYPQVFVCPYGWHFWGGVCQPDMNPTKQISEENSEENKINNGLTIETPTAYIDSFSNEKAISEPFLPVKHGVASEDGTTEDGNTEDPITSKNEFLNSFEYTTDTLI